MIPLTNIMVYKYLYYALNVAQIEEEGTILSYQPKKDK